MEKNVEFILNAILRMLSVSEFSFQFLKLPADIRIHFYKLAFGGSQIVLNGNRPYEVYKIHMHDLDILLLSRRIWEEAFPVFRQSIRSARLVQCWGAGAKDQIGFSFCLDFLKRDGGLPIDTLITTCPSSACIRRLLQERSEEDVLPCLKILEWRPLCIRSAAEVLPERIILANADGSLPVSRLPMNSHVPRNGIELQNYLDYHIHRFGQDRPLQIIL